MRCVVLVVFFLLGGIASPREGAGRPLSDPLARHVLWYDAPAARWEEALPVGSGALGAMVFGGALAERIALNEETIWAGAPDDLLRYGAHEHLRRLLAKSTYPNLFDDHPPFQIDGKFGGAAGVAEMLLQSHDGAVHLLPVLPAAWPTGSAEGLRARSAVGVDVAWTDGAPTSATLRPDVDGPIRLRTAARGEVSSRPVRARSTRCGRCGRPSVRLCCARPATFSCEVG